MTTAEEIQELRKRNPYKDEAEMVWGEETWDQCCDELEKFGKEKQNE